MPGSSPDRPIVGASAPPAPAQPFAAHVPPAWAEAAERIRRDGARMVPVLGATDAGKSTLCRFLWDQATAAGRKAALLDTDIGQKTVGPPACVTAQDADGASLFFVGTTNPVAGWRRLVEGTRRLAQGLEADVILANTSGLLAGPGRRLKAAKIQALRPDLLIVLGDGPDLEAILGDHPGTPVLRLPSSPEARRKTDGEKRAARREAFRRYFAGAPAQGFDARRLRLDGEQEALLPGLLLGLSGEDDGRHDLGILVAAPGDGTLEILTPAAESGVRRIVPGSLRLDGAFSEKRAKLVA